MKFLLDENFPRSAADFIESCGHEAVLFEDACDFGDGDETVFSAAQRLGATILTSDRDFYHTIPLLHPSHAGIVVVALRQPNRAAIFARIKWFMENITEPLDNRVFILRDFSYRARQQASRGGFAARTNFPIDGERGFKGVISYEDVQQRIVRVREQPVIIDADVASLYGVETKRVNEAVRNNPEKFPGDYMFELTSPEVCDLRSKIQST